MPAHLRPLPRCNTCSRPATEMLYNAVNAPSGYYCDKHAKKALKDWREKWEGL